MTFDLEEMRKHKKQLDPDYWAPGPNINNFTQIISRKQWGAMDPKEVIPLKHPTAYVLFTITNTEPCQNTEECTKAVQAMQKKHMDDGLPDIRFNFLLGDDLNVYEGRGWHVQPSVWEDRFEKKAGNMFEIAYIGKLEDTSHPSDKVLEVRDALIMMGFKYKYLDESKFLKPQ